ncbi:hypothetical protein U1Q18_032549 [Sarracenia purpurea var. burkii]
MTTRAKSQRLKEGMAQSEEMSRGGGSTGTKPSSSPFAKELDAVIMNPPLRPRETEKTLMDSSFGPNRVSKDVNPKLPLAMDDLHLSAMVMAEAQTPGVPAKDTTDVGNVAEKV